MQSDYIYTFFGVASKQLTFLARTLPYLHSKLAKGSSYNILLIYPIYPTSIY